MQLLRTHVRTHIMYTLAERENIYDSDFSNQLSPQNAWLPSMLQGSSVQWQLAGSETAELFCTSKRFVAFWFVNGLGRALFLLTEAVYMSDSSSSALEPVIKFIYLTSYTDNFLFTLVECAVDYKRL